LVKPTVVKLSRSCWSLAAPPTAVLSWRIEFATKTWVTAAPPPPRG
jgi:hypothetical protein